MVNKSPKLFVFTGPSGVGKGTLLNEFLKQNPNIKYSISSTTRAPRQGEIDGVNYFFISKEKFEEDINNNKFLEWAKYNENYYGTSFDFVNSEMEKGHDVLLEIEVQGAIQIMDKMKNCVSIFILPPSTEELEKRLKGRNTEDIETVNRRLKIAHDEIAKANLFKYNVINDKIESAVEKLNDIYKRETNER